MDIRWEIGERDIAKIRDFPDRQKDNPFVLARIKRNLSSSKPVLGREEFWHQMVSIRLTTQQRSGPDRPVPRFIRTNPFLLDYHDIRNKPNLESFIASKIQNFGGIRHQNNIGRDLAQNPRRLESGEWDSCLRQCAHLDSPTTPNIEREVANYVQDQFKGFGPKQARNILQALGLTRYEIPVDSRITRWLNRFGFPFRLNSTALADRDFYAFVSDGIQALCAECHIFPCVLDASIFSSADGDGWTDENVIY